MTVGHRVVSVYGGHPIETEENALKEPPFLLIGTPGRLCDHIRRGNIPTAGIKMLIIDEFDKSLDMGFDEEMSFALAALTGLERRIYTSATDMEAIPEYASAPGLYKLDLLQKHDVEVPGLMVRVVQSGADDKGVTLTALLCQIGAETSIVFCNHREQVERVGEILAAAGLVNTIYHGGMEQQDREVTLAKFRNGTARILVATELGARGLDVDGVGNVIHFDMPTNPESYVHRNGRTARAGGSGTVYLLLAGKEYTPPFVAAAGPNEYKLPPYTKKPIAPEWDTLMCGAGQKEKIGKGDIAGFLHVKGALHREDLGLIEIKNHYALAAVKKSETVRVLAAIRGEKIKNLKVLFRKIR